MANNLLAIKEYGQQIWLDNLSRNLIESQTLSQLIQKDGISGITSNPTIFHKAISQDPLYQDDLEQLKQSDKSLDERYESLVIPDIQAACDLFLPLYRKTNKEEGYVSFELSPLIANDLDKTIQSAIQTWEKINRPNLMIKIPATSSGIIALEQLIFAGININVTLIFSLSQVHNTWEAYLRGLTRRNNQDLKIDHIRGVASFFLSRIDSSVDPLVDLSLQGKCAISVAKRAYQIYLELFEGSAFEPLKQVGGVSQLLLFASTGTKNPKYSDVLYVEELIGKNTVNTVPSPTLDAFADHGVAADRLMSNLEDATFTLEQINQVVNLEELGSKLQLDGLKSFEDSYNLLLDLVK